MDEGPESETYKITNKAAYRYLQALLYSDPELALPEGKSDKKYAALIEKLKKIKEKIPKEGEYNSKINYAALYTQLHELSEKIKFIPSSKIDNENILHQFHRSFFTRLYENHSELYKDIHQELIQSADPKLAKK